MFASEVGLLGVNVHRPKSLAEARSLLSQNEDAVLVSGGTWVMRSPMRGEIPNGDYVLLTDIAELKEVHRGDPLVIGAMTSLFETGRLVADVPGARALLQAVTVAATPALRRQITIGGSCAARDFAASDVVPALMCLDADIVDEGGIVTSIRLPITERRSWHERLTWRSGGEYSVATISISANADGTDFRVVLGSVERAPRRWAEVEQALDGCDPATVDAVAIGRQHAGGLDPVEAPGIPADYRREVVPVVLQRAVRSLS